MRKFSYIKILGNIGLFIALLFYFYLCFILIEMSIAISIITGLIALSFYTKTKDEKCKYIIKKIDEEIGVEYFSNYLQKEIEIKKAINDILK